MAAELAPLIERLEKVTSRLEAVSVSPAPNTSLTEVEEVGASVLAFDELINGPLAKFLSISNDLGDVIKQQCNLVQVGFQAERDFLLKASRSKQPSQDVLSKLVEPVSQQMTAIGDIREANRRSQFFNHLSTISESVSALGWLVVSPAPGPYVKEMLDAGQFYGNRVLKEFKDKDTKHVEWINSWKTTLMDLQAYIKQYHTTGVTWNPKGGDANAAAKRPAPPVPGVAPPPVVGGAPPPPPPPAVLPLAPAVQTKDSEGNDRSALLGELNKGTDITKGLKKISDDSKTHKNPNLRLGAAPYKAPSGSPKSVKAQAPKPEAPKKPPVCELQGKKWIVEHQEGNRNIVLENTNIKQTVYVFKCVNSVINVKGKVNSITLDNCKKTALVFENVVSSAEFINCQSVQAQVTGKVPTVSIDKTDGFMIYMNKDSLDASFITAKSSEMNVLVPKDNGDFAEYAVPEQFRTSWNGSGLVTVCSETG